MPTKKKNGTLRPYVVGRVDNSPLPTGKKHKRFKNYPEATNYIVGLPDGIEYFIESPGIRSTIKMALPDKIVEDGIYIDVQSDSRDDLKHHVYTGDAINSLKCTCEAFLHGTVEPNVLYTCTHIRREVYGLEK